MLIREQLQTPQQKPNDNGHSKYIPLVKQYTTATCTQSTN